MAVVTGSNIGSTRRVIMYRNNFDELFFFLNMDQQNGESELMFRAGLMVKLKNQLELRIQNWQVKCSGI